MMMKIHLKRDFLMETLNIIIIDYKDYIMNQKCQYKNQLISQLIKMMKNLILNLVYYKV